MKSLKFPFIANYHCIKTNRTLPVMVTGDAGAYYDYVIIYIEEEDGVLLELRDGTQFVDRIRHAYYNEITPIFK